MLRLRTAAKRAPTIATAPWRPSGWIDSRDIVTAAKLACCLAAAAMPARRWPAAARTLAAAHLRLRPEPIRRLARSAMCGERDANAVALDAVAADYLANIQALREALPGGWRRDLPIAGLDVLERALRASRGAVLWCSPFAGSDLAIKKALAQAGHFATHLSAPSHPFSATRFGSHFLNPVRLRAVRRHIARRVLVVYGHARPAIDALEDVVRANGIVTIVAVGTGRGAASFAFAGGTTDVALGAPLVAYETGAALIPAFTLSDGDGGYRIELGPEIPRPSLPKAQALQAMAARYVELLAPIVREHAAQWEGWFHPGTWRPNG